MRSRAVGGQMEEEGWRSEDGVGGMEEGVWKKGVCRRKRVWSRNEGLMMG